MPRKSKEFINIRAIASHSKILMVLVLSLLLAACANDDKQSAEEAQRHVDRATAYMDQGQYRAALIEARNAVKKAPENPASLQAMSTLLSIIGDNRGITELLEGKANLPADSSLLLATAFLDIGKYRSCRETLESIAPAERGPAWQIVRARAMAGAGNVEAAKTELKQLELRYPDIGEINLRLSQLATMENNVAEAEIQLEQALIKDANNVDALYTLGILHYRKNDLEAAAQTLTDALGYTTAGDIMTLDRSRIVRSLAQILSEMGRSSEALVYQRLLADSNPEAVEAQRKFGDALELYKQGDMDGAQALLDELYRANPGNSTNALLLGVINFQKQEFDAADALFSDHLDTELASPQVISAAVITQVQLQKQEQALELLTEALKDHPNNPDLWALYGLTLFNQNRDSEEGLAALEKALELDPGPERNNLRTALAQYHLSKGDPDTARKRLAEALEADADNTAVQNNYLTALLREKKFPLAKQFVDSTEKKGANAFSIALMRARLAEAQGERKNLIKQLEKAASLDKKRPEPLLTLARLYLRDKEFSSARKHFDLALKRDPTSVIAFQGIVTAWEAETKPEKARAALEKLAKELDNDNVRAVLADYYARRGEIELALPLLRTLGIDNPQSYPAQSFARIVANLAAQSLSAEKPQQAIDIATEALARKPDNPVLLQLTASTFIAAGEYDDASAIIGRIAAINGSEQAVRELSGDLAVAKQSTGEAITAYRNAWNNGPTPQLARKLSAQYQARGNAADSRAFTAEWAEKLPNDFSGQLQYAGMLQGDGDCSKAMEIYENLLPRVNGNAAIAVVNNMALCSIESDPERSIKFAAEAYRLAPDAAAIMDTYGWVLFKSGDIDKGLELIRGAAEKAPDNAEIQAHLKEVLAAKSG